MPTYRVDQKWIVLKVCNSHICLHRIVKNERHRKNKLLVVFSSVVTLKFSKEYLNTVTHNTPVLLWIKTEESDIQNAILSLHIRELQTFKNSAV